jgi:anaerobic selenocysteine-containing dehydrogenase
MAEPILGGPASVVATACPLDCPDACSLAVTVQQGKVITIDGSHKNPVTGGYICAKVRKFDQRLYGPDRLLYPAIRKGRKGEGRFKRASWDEALQLIVERMQEAKSAHGAEAILPYSYGGSNGLLTQDNLDAQLSLIKHGIPTHNYPTQIHLRDEFGGMGDLIAFLLDAHLSQHHALLGQVGRPQMHASGFSQWDRSP